MRVRRPDTVSLEYYRQHRRFTTRSGIELFCVTDEKRQIMQPAAEDIGFIRIPIPKELGHVEYAAAISHEPDSDGVWGWYVDEEENPRAIDPLKA